MLKAMLVASAVLPMPGRPATMTRSEGCRPPILLSRSRGRWRCRTACRRAGRPWPPCRRRSSAPGRSAGSRRRSGRSRRVRRACARRPRSARAARVDRRVEGDVDHVLADADQVAAHRQIVDGAAVILGIDDGGRFGGEAGEILRRPSCRRCRVSPRKVFSVTGVAILPSADQAAGDLVDALVDRLEEMLGSRKSETRSKASLLTRIAPSRPVPPRYCAVRGGMSARGGHRGPVFRQNSQWLAWMVP